MKWERYNFRTDALVEIIPYLDELRDRWPIVRALAAKPVRVFMPEERRPFEPDDDRYDLGRIRYMVTRMKAGHRFMPVELTLEEGYAHPFIWDGRHRLISAIYAGVPTIPVKFWAEPGVYVQSRHIISHATDRIPYRPA